MICHWISQSWSCVIPLLPTSITQSLYIYYHFRVIGVMFEETLYSQFVVPIDLVDIDSGIWYTQ